MMHSNDIALSEIDRLTELHVRDCYQCGKCSAGCPVADRMDLLPNQVLGLVQHGRIEKAMQSEAIWNCVSCMTCSTRCPKAVDCAGVMDVVRQLSFERGAVSETRRRTVLFQQAFLENIRRNGRLRELELVGVFKSRAFLRDHNVRLLFKDSLLAPKLARRGKLHFAGQRVKDRGLVGRIFQRCMGEGKE